MNRKTYLALLSALLGMMFVPSGAFAQTVAVPIQQPIAPLVEPYISVSPDTFYTLDEALFIVGRSEPKAIVKVTLMKQGELPVRFTVSADSNGEWTVSEERVYLSSGNWEVRATQQVASQVSPSSNPRLIRSVVTGVTIFGVSIRYTIIAAVTLTFLVIVIAILVYFRRKISRLQQGLMEKHLRETEERFHRGFSEIRKDLMDQLRDLASNSQNRPLTPEEVEKRDRVLRELEELEKNLEHDVTSIGRRP
jgi:ABC-type multidrug transport system fused ATPase/permease subunit